jgi:hypothetical protein
MKSGNLNFLEPYGRLQACNGTDLPLPLLASSYLSVRRHGTTRLPLDGFSWNLIFEYFFRRTVEKIQVLLKSSNNNGDFTRRHIYNYDNISLSFLRIRNISDKFVEKLEIQILYLIFVVPSIMLYSSEISPTRCNNCVFIHRNGFTLHVSGNYVPIIRRKYRTCATPGICHCI